MADLNDSVARVYVSHVSQVKCIKANDIKEGDKDIILNDFLDPSEEINLGDVKEGFIFFKNLKTTSKIYKEGGFLEKLGAEGRDYAKGGNPFFYQKEKFNTIKGFLEEGEEVCLLPMKYICLTTISINASKDVQDLISTCGHKQIVSPIAKFEVSISGNLEVMPDSSCGEKDRAKSFFELVFQEFFNSFKYKENLPSGFKKQQSATDFIWTFQFQSKSTDCDCHHWFNFKGKITSVGVTKDVNNPQSDFAPTIAVQGFVAHQQNCSTMEIFGDEAEKEDPEEVEKKKM